MFSAMESVLTMTHLNALMHEPLWRMTKSLGQAGTSTGQKSHPFAHGIQQHAKVTQKKSTQLS